MSTTTPGTRVQSLRAAASLDENKCRNYQRRMKRYREQRNACRTNVHETMDLMRQTGSLVDGLNQAVETNERTIAELRDELASAQEQLGRAVPILQELTERLQNADGRCDDRIAKELETANDVLIKCATRLKKCRNRCQ